MSWLRLISAALNQNSNQNSSPPKELENLQLIATENDYKFEDPNIANKKNKESFINIEFKVHGISY
jgi:hypothetical protein